MTNSKQDIIKEIKHCEDAIEGRFDVYVANAVSRLIEARIQLHDLETKQPLNVIKGVKK
jgi:hypothetical protein